MFNKQSIEFRRVISMMHRFANTNEKLILTEDERDERVAQLRKLQKERRRLAEAIHEAASHGDLSENFEYHAAKQELRMVDARYAELDRQLSSARVLTQREINLVARRKQVTPFSTFQLEVNERKGWYSFRKGDMRPRAKIITINSPLGRSILGKKAGDFVDYSVGSREFEVEILKVVPYSKSLK